MSGGCGGFVVVVVVTWHRGGLTWGVVAPMTWRRWWVDELPRFGPNARVPDGGRDGRAGGSGGTRDLQENCVRKGHVGSGPS